MRVQVQLQEEQQDLEHQVLTRCGPIHRTQTTDQPLPTGHRFIMMKRTAEVERKTRETNIRLALNLDGCGQAEISSGIPFFDHMLTLLTLHGLLDISLQAEGDLGVDYHHTVEDVGLVFGDALAQALGERKGIRRFGHAVTPMDDALAAVTIDLSNRPFFVYHVPSQISSGSAFSHSLAKEFFRALVTRGGMNLHIIVLYGENEHHILESIFKSFGRALDQAASCDERITGVHSTKGTL
jgi:imidazoleglycerol-phosphate dehydratase